MPAKLPYTSPAALERLRALGAQIRAHRTALRISATAAAQAGGMSRVTWHRVEQGEPAVTMGAYANAMAALGLAFGLIDGPDADDMDDRKGWIPARIHLANYPQLKALAWQVQGRQVLTPAEALGIYERNARHLDAEALQPAERDLIEALRLALAPPGVAVADV